MASRPPSGSAPEGRRWTPPPEARGAESWLGAAGRIALLLGVLVGGYLLLAGMTHVLFTPLLVVEEAVVPDQPVPVGSGPVRVGLSVRNARLRDGAAYVVAVLQTPAGESEVEGPVVDVPARDTVVVPVDLHLPPGEHVFALLLYDAWRDNVRSDARYGLRVRVGIPMVAAVRTDLPRRLPAAGSVTVTVWAANRGVLDEVAVPIIVFIPRDGGPAIEREGGSSLVPAGETIPVPLTFETDGIPPGAYHAAIRFLNPEGGRIGRRLGLYRIPVEIR